MIVRLENQLEKSVEWSILEFQGEIHGADGTTLAGCNLGSLTLTSVIIN